MKNAILAIILVLTILISQVLAIDSPSSSSKLDTEESRIYFISPDGDDSNTGLSRNKPWQTLSKVNSTTFNPGDQVLFEGGKTFFGSLKVKGSGLPNQPITLSVYGAQTPNIYSEEKIGAIINTNYIHIKGLNFIGSLSTQGKHFGILLKNESVNQIEGITLENLNISNYGEHGIMIKSSENGDHGFSNLRLKNITSHDNRGDGIRVRGSWNKGSWNKRKKVYSHSNFYISDCKLYNNSGYDTQHSSGNGLMLSDVDGVIVEYCEAFNNGYNWGGRGGGPVGIWSWDSNNVIIQHSESHHNKNGLGRYDGGGFDIDGGDTNSVIQYCYSHDNEGPGYFLAHFSASSPTNNNVIRYNISENDAQSTVQGALNLWTADQGELTDNWIYNNVIYGNAKTTAVFMRESSGARNWVINNVFITAPGATLLKSQITPDILYRNNTYWSTNGLIKINWGNESYETLADWRLSSGQETYEGEPVGLYANPRLAHPGSGGTIGDPHRLNELGAYQIRPDSPLIDTGLSLKDQLGHNPGLRDFFGNKIPLGKAYDMGVHEFIN